MSGKEREHLLGAANEARFKYLSLCGIRYRRTDKCVSSKAALLTLVWTVVVFTGAQCLLETNGIYTIPHDYLLLNALGKLIYKLLYIPAGFFADVVIGRHRAITWSVYILLALITVAYFSLTIIQPAVLYRVGKNLRYLAPAWSVPVNIIRVMFVANIVQFGVDQVHDSPTDHQSLFIYWFYCAYTFSEFVAEIGYSFKFLQKPKSNTRTNFTITEVSILIFFACTTLLILLVSVFVARYRKRWFFNNPLKMNPYKLVFKVTKFGYQHRAPLNRSAFTYCEDEIPSGLDLGKQKYGGPFTTEQVEDVKSFYGILKLLFLSATSSYLRYALHYKNPISYFNFSMDIKWYFALTSLLPPVVTLLYIFIIKPVLGVYIPGMLKRMGAGLAVALLALLYAFVSSIIKQPWNSKDLNCSLSNLENVQNSSKALMLFEGVSFKVILNALSSLATLLTIVAQYEFICSQSPDFMKGFLIGISVSLSGICELFGSIVGFLVSLIPGSFGDCYLIFPIVSIAFGFVSLIGYVCAAKKY